MIKNFEITINYDLISEVLRKQEFVKDGRVVTRRDLLFDVRPISEERVVFEGDWGQKVHIGKCFKRLTKAELASGVRPKIIGSAYEIRYKDNVVINEDNTVDLMEGLEFLF